MAQSQSNHNEMEAVMEDSELPSLGSPVPSETTSQRRRRLDQHQHPRNSNRRDPRRYGL